MQELRRFVTVAILWSCWRWSPLIAADEVSRAIKQMIDHRADDFASIRKDGQEAYGETDYKSSVVVPPAKECYIRQEMKPRYADSCDVAESKNRALVLGKYATYVKELRAFCASFVDQLDRAANQAHRRKNVCGAGPLASGGHGGLGCGGHERKLLLADRNGLRGRLRNAAMTGVWTAAITELGLFGS